MDPTHAAPAIQTPGLAALEAQAANLRKAIDALKAAQLHDCADCERPTHECVCSEAVNANTAIKEG